MINGKQSFLDYDMSKAFSAFSFPGFNVEAMMAAQRKNVEAFTQANQLAIEGVQALARRQVELAREAFEGALVTKTHLLLHSLDNVNGRITLYTPQAGGGWSKTALKLDDLASQLGFKSADDLFEVVGKDEFSLRNIEMLLRPPEPPAPAPTGLTAALGIRYVTFEVAEPRLPVSAERIEPDPSGQR